MHASTRTCVPLPMQGRKDVAMKAFGALTAVQLALLPLTGEDRSMLDIVPAAAFNISVAVLIVQVRLWLT